MKPRVSVVVTAREEGEAITGALALIGEAVSLPVRDPRGLRLPTTRPCLGREICQGRRPGTPGPQQLRPRPGPGHTGRVRRGRGRRGGRHDGRRLRRPAADRPAHPAGRTGRGRGCGIALFQRGPAGRRAAPKGADVTYGRSVVAGPGPGRHLGPDQFLQGVRPQVCERSGHSTATRVSKSGWSW